MRLWHLVSYRRSLFEYSSPRHGAMSSENVHDPDECLCTKCSGVRRTIFEQKNSLLLKIDQIELQIDVARGEFESLTHQLVAAQRALAKEWKVFAPIRHEARKHPDLFNRYLRTWGAREEVQRQVERAESSWKTLKTDRDVLVDLVATLICKHRFLLRDIEKRYRLNATS